MGRPEKDILAEIEQYSGKYFPGTKMIIHGFAGRNEKNQIMVLCSSESRGVFYAIWNEVRRGNTKGTVRGESRIKRNYYEIDGDIARIFFSKDKFFICDVQFLEIVKSHTWYLNKNGYARSSVDGKYFHRIVTNAGDGFVVDHINRDKLDNRMCNLRVCKPADNSHNMNVFSTNTSGHTGVYKTKHGKYNACIVVNYEKINLGNFDNYEDACTAYDEAKNKYHLIEVMSEGGLAGTD